MDGKLSATLAAYQLTKTNIGTIDPANPDFSIPVGEIRNRGIELDVAGEILPGWKVIASYGYIDSKVTETSDPDSFPVGLLSANVPRNTASLWTTYEFQKGSNLEGFGFGFGIFYSDEQPGDFSNTFTLPSYVRTDAALFYRRNNWKAAINVRNLVDTEYYESVEFGRLTVHPGAPLTIVGSFSITF